MAKIEISEDVLKELFSLANDVKDMESKTPAEKEAIETRAAKIREMVEIPSDITTMGAGCMACGACITCGPTPGLALVWSVALVGLT